MVDVLTMAEAYALITCRHSIGGLGLGRRRA